jgi:hypothetical protein
VDIYCTRCGEPWDIATFHEVIDEQHADAIADLRETHYGVRTADEVYGRNGHPDRWTSVKSQAYQADYERLFWKPMLDRFHSEGCAATGWCPPCEPRRTARSMAASALYEIMGDDVDGIAAILEDAEYMGLLD